MKKLSWFLLAVLVGVPCLQATADGEMTNVTWSSSLSLGATVKSGNTDKALYTMDFKADRRAPKSDWISSLHGEYGETKNQDTGQTEQTEGQVRGQSEYRHKFGDKHWFGGVFGEAYHDALKDINYRLKIGPDIGYYFIDRDDMKLDASLGVNYVYESTAKGTSDYAEYRAASHYLWNFTDKSSYYLNVEYSARATDVDDGNGLLVTGVKSQLKDNLSMFVELRDEYDNLPDGSDIEHNDLTFLAGLTYDFL